MSLARNYPGSLKATESQALVQFVIISTFKPSWHKTNFHPPPSVRLPLFHIRWLNAFRNTQTGKQLN